MNDTARSILLGIIQGLTEFFPVSSSGHLHALRHMTGFDDGGLAFDVALHLATLLAVLLYFRRDILGLLSTREGARLLALISAATLPAVVVALAFKDAREALPIWAPIAGWAFSGTYLLLSRRFAPSTEGQPLAWRQALLIGVAQSMAIFPGVSRSGITITAGLLLGLGRVEAARFSFLLSIPAILGAGALEGWEILKAPELKGRLFEPLVFGMPAAFLVGVLAIHLLLRAVRSNFFHRFGWYNYLAAAIFGLYLLVGG